MSARTYIACALAGASHAEGFAHILVAAGNQVVSRWHHVVQRGAVDPLDAETRAQILRDNLDDLWRADVLVLLGHIGTPRATFGEAVWMLAHDYPVIWVHGQDGKGRCIWDAHPLVTRVAAGDGWMGEVLRALVAIEAAERVAGGGE